MDSTWTIPIDGTRRAIGPFPFTVRKVTIQNRCTAGNIWAVDDRGAQYEATPLTAVESKAEDTMYMTVYCDAPQSVGAASIIVSSEEAVLDVSSSQLSSQAQAGSGSNVLVPVVALAAFPPAAPVDGQTVWLVLPSSFDPVGGKPIRWLCVYDAANALWHVTGAPLYAEVQTSEATASAAYTDLATVGPSITIPRAGDYQVHVEASFNNSTNVGIQGFMGYAGAGITASDADAGTTQDAGAGGPHVSQISTTREKVTLTASAVVAKYRSSGANSNFGQRRLMIKPLRIT